jgi:hypothetical protein
MYDSFCPKASGPEDGATFSEAQNFLAFQFVSHYNLVNFITLIKNRRGGHVSSSSVCYFALHHPVERPGFLPTP